MNLFGHLPTSFLNDVDITDTSSDVTQGPFQLAGVIGAETQIDDVQAAKRSKVSVGNLFGGTYKLVRTKVGSVAPLVVGGPVFWGDKSKFEVTPDATALSEFAGVALNVPTLKGNIVMIQVEGLAVALCKAALTKVGAVNDPVVLNIAGGVATVDVILDATSWTNVQQALHVGFVAEPLVNGALKKIWLQRRTFVKQNSI